MRVLGKGYVAWWNPDVYNMDTAPSPNSQIAYVETDAETDILLPFVLNLNIIFGHATMAPLNLVPYSGDAPLGKPPRIWTDN